MKTKICSKCGKEKELVEFYKDKKSKNNLYYNKNALITRLFLPCGLQIISKKEVNIRR